MYDDFDDSEQEGIDYPSSENSDTNHGLDSDDEEPTPGSRSSGPIASNKSTSKTSGKADSKKPANTRRKDAIAGGTQIGSSGKSKESPKKLASDPKKESPTAKGAKEKTKESGKADKDAKSSK